jgi:hypothetical protein
MPLPWACALVLSCVATAAPVQVLQAEPLAPLGAAGTSAELDLLVRALAGRIDPRVAEVLPHIDGVGARLLALRSYLRSGERLGERWSWTEQQIAAYDGSPEQRELDAEVQRVRDEFERANPGFELFVNPQVRSLDRQLRNWNQTESVALAAARLLQDAHALLASAAADPAAREAAVHEFLATYRPEPTPTVAAPGLSPHGQMRAIDFQVHRGGEIVAGPDTRTIESTWQQGGWAARLDAAVNAASRSFIGPLVAPAEPWHYTYAPEALAGQ